MISHTINNMDFEIYHSTRGSARKAQKGLLRAPASYQTFMMEHLCDISGVKIFKNI